MQGSNIILVILETSLSAGHHRSYIDLMRRNFSVSVTKFHWGILWLRAPVMFLMIEQFPIQYSVVAFLRSLIGRRTIGLLFRPLPALNGMGCTQRVKRSILKLLRRFRLVQTLTIMPFAVEPRFSEIAHGWIYDPQMWDLTDADRDQVAIGKGALLSEIRASAAGRGICSAIGRQDRAKGFDLFSRIYQANPALRMRMLFASGGKVEPVLAEELAQFRAAGGLAIDRFVNDEELLDLYAAADIVWCWYDSNYDQASGVFGRAAQLGLPVVTRRGSLVHRLCEIEEISHVAISGADEWEAILSASSPDPSRGAMRAHLHGEISRARLKSAFGLRG